MGKSSPIVRRKVGAGGKSRGARPLTEERAYFLEAVCLGAVEAMGRCERYALEAYRASGQGLGYYADIRGDHGRDFRVASGRLLHEKNDGLGRQRVSGYSPA